MKTNNPKFSVVIPCYNEAENILVLYEQLLMVFMDLGVTYECVFVDDGSDDGTLDIIKEIAETNSNLKYISFSRNFGHQKALIAGLCVARGEGVITMDADLQHPVRILPRFLDLWKEGYEVVNTLRTDKKSLGRFKRTTSALFYSVMNLLTGLKLQQGSADFRLLDAKVVAIIRESKEDNLFLRGMICWYGFKQTNIVYQADERHAGTTKFSLCKMMSLALNGVTSFTIKPLRLATVLAGCFALFSLIEIGYVFYTACFTHHAVSGWSSLAILISLLGAVTLLMLGIVGEYVGRAFMQGKGRAAYIIAQTNVDDMPTEDTPKKVCHER
ncbi:MAG: glycosyltransferase family 2 protein [Bacteroidaceae bacterium]